MDILERACNLKLFKFVNHDNSQVNNIHPSHIYFSGSFFLLSITFFLRKKSQRTILDGKKKQQKQRLSE